MDLVLKLNKQEVLEATIHQICKDFNWENNFDIGVTSNQDVFAKLVLKVDERLQELIEKDFGSLMNLLYRIDVSEKRLKQELNASNENSSRVMAKLIVMRELQKVVTRIEYSNGNKN